MDNNMYKIIKGLNHGINLALYESLKSHVESQTVLQLLVSKNIVTREEVSKTREYVENNTDYGKLIPEFLAKIISDGGDADMVTKEFILAKMLDPNSLSEKDNELLAKILQREYANRDMDRLEDILDRKLHGEEISEEDNKFALDLLDKMKSKEQSDE